MSRALADRSTRLYDRQQISEALDRIAENLNRRCAGQEWLVLCVMNGGLMVTSELLQRFSFDVRLDHLKVSRYHEQTSGRELVWYSHPAESLRGRHILLIDDIFDEGATLAAIHDYCLEAGAATVLSAVLVQKDHDRVLTTYRPDEVGLICPDVYIFGFGMDAAGLSRNLPEIRQLRQTD
ncbi:MAG: hypoxanthine-guanine phosphoribosyltransferase [Pseudomonadales bacterium]|nr:hypoxanthine-guanine phosphoribosyltransferase [Pseudomonadales bacterium]